VRTGPTAGTVGVDAAAALMTPLTELVVQAALELAPPAGLYADKWMPSISDTVTKVVGTHTIKAGFFWEWIRNAQPANNNTNGALNVWSGGGSANRPLKSGSRGTIVNISA